jgi:hypothetical protein
MQGIETDDSKILPRQGGSTQLNGVESDDFAISDQTLEIGKDQ